MVETIGAVASKRELGKSVQAVNSLSLGHVTCTSVRPGQGFGFGHVSALPKYSNFSLRQIRASPVVNVGVAGRPAVVPRAMPADLCRHFVCSDGFPQPEGPPA